MVQGKLANYTYKANKEKHCEINNEMGDVIKGRKNLKMVGSG